MKGLHTRSVSERDHEHLWHPYAALGARSLVVREARGVRLVLEDGTELIDGMSSWWSVIHGYRHPVLDAALTAQAGRMSHVMFGGLTHEPAVELAERLLRVAPRGLHNVFFCDSGSVSVEVALKMALQFQTSIGEERRTKLCALRGGYHGDTFGAMSVTDPGTGYRQPVSGVAEQPFLPRPSRRFGEPLLAEDRDEWAKVFRSHAPELAAVIVEPVVQGAGGMWFYSADYLSLLRQLCDESGVLLICDEIATGFGRTGRWFASEHAGVVPDILCVGKALTGGYLSLAATLATRRVAEGIAQGEPGVLLHGPTFMANPLACAVANASIDLLLGGTWQDDVNGIELGLQRGLAACRGLPGVADVRVLGAVGVVELTAPVDVAQVQRRVIQAGVWLRPFRNLVYTMPPYCSSPDEVAQITAAMAQAIGGD